MTMILILYTLALSFQITSQQSALNDTYCSILCPCDGVFNTACACVSTDESYTHINISELLRCIPTSVRSLDISKHNIGSIQSGAFQHLRGLDHLNLTDCNVTFLEPNAFQGINVLFELLVVDLAKDNPGISYLSYHILRHFPSLNTLTLGKVEKIEKSTFAAVPKLNILIVKHKSLVKHYHAFRALRNLEVLYLNDIGLTKIPDFILSNLASLSQLYLYNNNISNLTFKGGIPRLNYLRVEIMGNKIAAITKDEISQFKNAEMLSMAFDDNDIQYIEPNLFQEIKQLRYLRFTRNRNFRYENFVVLIKSLQQKQIRTIILTACGIVIGKFHASILRPLSQSILLELNLEENTIETYENDTFKYLPLLLVLQISNFMNIGSETISSLKLLTYLNVHDMPILQFPDRHVVCNLNELKYLNQLAISRIDGTRVTFQFGELSNLNQFQFPYMSQSFGQYQSQIVSLFKRHNSSQFHIINLSGNLMFQYPDDNLCALFVNIIATQLHLTDNYFTNLPSCMFQRCQVERLYLNRNRITYIQHDLFKLNIIFKIRRFKFIDLSENAISSIDGTSFDSMLDNSDIWIHNNLLACDCNMRQFRNWVKAKNKEGSAVIKHDEFCKSPIERTNDKFLHYEMTWLECNTELFVQICAVAGSGIILLIIIALSLLKYFWRDIKYRQMVRKAQGHNGIIHDNDDNQEVEIYDAFVSYHSEKRIWVNQVMTPELNRGDLNFTLIHDDNIIPGQESYFGGIMTHMDRSHHIIFLVTRGWMKEGWNEFEMNAAIDMLSQTKRHTLIVILMENIPQKEMSGELRLMVRNNVCLKWSEEEGKQRKFWRDLKLELGKKKFNMK